MTVLTEAMLRSALPSGDKLYPIQPGTLITEPARRYALEQGITIQEAAPYGVMSVTPIDRTSPTPFENAETGERYAAKPEHMTHLRGNLLVEKTHPRIAFRGKLDALQGEIIVLQAAAHNAGRDVLVDRLEELLSLVRQILAAEVKDTPLPPFSLWGMDADAVRKSSHNVRDSVGIEHPIPSWRMGQIPSALNLLRTHVRETELAAAAAFPGGKAHQDLLLALNRLSSAVYLLFCQEVKDHG